MKIKLIVAHDINLGIGKDNKLMWDIPEDMGHFVKETKGKVIVMGSNTYYSIGRPLRDRVNVVLTSKKYLNSEFEESLRLGGLSKFVDGEFCFPENYKNGLFDSVESILETYKDEDEIIVIGGDSVYRQFIDIADELIVTVVMNMYNADTHFPYYIDRFEEVSRTDVMKSKNGEEFFYANFKSLKK